MPKQKPIKSSTELDVIVTVRGGVAEVFKKPFGVTLVILDYDVEGASKSDPRISRDTDGHLCSIGRWGSQEQLPNP
jgi:hypothetical protein